MVIDRTANVNIVSLQQYTQRAQTDRQTDTQTEEGQ